MASLERFIFGCLGGLLPTMLSLLSVDLAPLWDKSNEISAGVCVGYGVRVLVLILVGGLLAYLNTEVKTPLSLVQLGVAAPALFTAYVNGKPVDPAPQSAGFSMSIVAAAAAADSKPPEIRVAGGFLGDVLEGFGTRLDQVQSVRQIDRTQNVTGSGTQATVPGQAPGDDGGGLPQQGSPQSQPMTPNIGSTGIVMPMPGQPGQFCATMVGRYGPGPYQPIGSPCFIQTPNGTVQGFIVN